ncbi:MAG: V-type ATP synthase subunit F [Promethearchaeota archaeon]
MKIKILGDDESIIIFNLLGIDGIIIPDNDPHFKEKFEELLNEPDVGIIIITERIFIKYREYILPIKISRRLPIIVEIPEMLFRYHEDFIPNLIRKYVGVLFKE